jgi:hypothetical protein
MGHFSEVSWWAWWEQWGQGSRLCWRRCSGSWRRPAAALRWTGRHKVRARSAAGPGFLFAQAVGSVRNPNSSPDLGSPKWPPKGKIKNFFSCFQRKLPLLEFKRPFMTVFDPKFSKIVHVKKFCHYKSWSGSGLGPDLATATVPDPKHWLQWGSTVWSLPGNKQAYSGGPFSPY